MATKSKTRAKEEKGEAAVQLTEAEKTDKPDTVSVETAETSAPQGTEAPEPAVPEPAVPEPVTPEPAAPGADVSPEESPAPQEEARPELETVSLLAERHRVPGWQLAALLRFMDWNDDKMIREETFRQALAELKNRRTGGGRR